MESEVTKQLENWFIMLNSPDFDNNDAGMVREEIKEVLIKRYETKLGTKFAILGNQEGESK